MAYALGLPFLGLVRIVVPAFYALKDSKRPVLFATLAVIANLSLAALWVGPLKHNGLALALSASTVVNAAGLLFWLRKKLGPLGLKKMLAVGWRASLAAGAMGFLIWWPAKKGFIFAASSSLWRQGLELFLTVVVGITVFFVFAKALGCVEAKQALQIFKRKLIKSGPAAEAMD